MSRKRTNDFKRLGAQSIQNVRKHVKFNACFPKTIYTFFNTCEVDDSFNGARIHSAVYDGAPSL